MDNYVFIANWIKVDIVGSNKAFGGMFFFKEWVNLRGDGVFLMVEFLRGKRIVDSCITAQVDKWVV